MRIINLEQFRKLPRGVVFCKYEPCIFGELSIKHNTIEHDFFNGELVGNIDCIGSEDYANKCTMAENGESIDLCFDSIWRDGCFQKDQLFAVYEEQDLRGFINALEEAIPVDGLI